MGHHIVGLQQSLECTQRVMNVKTDRSNCTVTYVSLFFLSVDTVGIKPGNTTINAVHTDNIFNDHRQSKQWLEGSCVGEKRHSCVNDNNKTNYQNPIKKGQEGTCGCTDSITLCM